MTRLKMLKVQVHLLKQQDQNQVQTKVKNKGNKMTNNNDKGNQPPNTSRPFPSDYEKRSFTPPKSTRPNPNQGNGQQGQGNK